MKIHVSRVPPEGLREDATYSPKELDIERFDLHFQEPLAVSSFVTLADRELVVEADIQAKIRMACGRCLTEFDKPLATHATLLYEVTAGDTVDITEDVRQEVMLAFPMIPISRRDCKGLCAECGQNRNVGACPHHPE